MTALALAVGMSVLFSAYMVYSVWEAAATDRVYRRHLARVIAAKIDLEQTLRDECQQNSRLFDENLRLRHWLFAAADKLPPAEAAALRLNIVQTVKRASAEISNAALAD